MKLAEKAYLETIDILDQIVKAEEKRDQNYFHHNFFKAEKSTKEINKAFEE